MQAGLECVLIAPRRAGARSAAMHATPFLSPDRGRATGLARTCLGATSQTGHHRTGIARVIATQVFRRLLAAETSNPQSQTLPSATPGRLRRLSGRFKKSIDFQSWRWAVRLATTYLFLKRGHLFRGGNVIGFLDTLWLLVVHGRLLPSDN